MERPLSKEGPTVFQTVVTYQLHHLSVNYYFCLGSRARTCEKPPAPKAGVLPTELHPELLYFYQILCHKHHYCGGNSQSMWQDSNLRMEGLRPSALNHFTTHTYFNELIWQKRKDSDSHHQFWRLKCYHYTTLLYQLLCQNQQHHIIFVVLFTTFLYSCQILSIN